MKLTNFVLVFLSIFNIGFAQKQPPEIKVQIGHMGIITQTAISPDSKLVLSASWDRTIKLWEAATGRLIRTFEGHTGNVITICFSPDGNTFFSGSEDKTIIMWELSTGNVLKKFEEQGYEVSSVSISPDGNILASSDGAEIRIWDVSSAKLMTTLTGHSNTISRVNFSPDGKYIVSSAISELKIWDVATARFLKDFEKNNWVHLSPVFSPDGKYILSGSGDRKIKLWETATGSLVRTFEGHESRVTNVAFSPDGRFILTGSDDTKIILWDMTNSQIVNTFSFHKDEIRSVSFSPDGKYILSSTATEIMLSETETGRFVRSFEGHTSTISSMAYTLDGKFILTGCFDNTLKLWEISTGKLVSVFEGHTELVKAVAISRDGKYALSGSEDYTVKLWDISTAKLIKTFSGHENIVTSVAFSPDGKFAVSGSWDYTVRLWNISSGEIVNTYQGHNYFVTSVAYSPDGKYLLSGSFDNNVILWDISKTKPFKTFNYADKIAAVAFSPDGKKILSGSWDNNLALWDISTGKIIKIYEGHSYYISSVVFSPDGKNILSGSEDKTMKLWDVSSGKVLKTFEGHSSRIMSVCVSPDGRHALSCSGDNKMKLWDMVSGKEVVSFVTYQNRDYMVITPDNYYLCSKNGVKVIAFVTGNRAFPPEQFDLQYNRPDIVLERIGYVPKELIESYRRAYEKRLKKMKFTPDMFNEDFHLPEIELLTKNISISSGDKNIKFKIRSNDNQYKLDRLNVYVNDVPVYGTNGIDLRDKSTSAFEQDIVLELNDGNNKIQVSCLNDKGAESLKETFEITYNGPAKESRKYFIGIGVSNYQDSKMKLNYSVKDINDLSNAFQGNDAGTDLTTLIDEQVTKGNIIALKEKLMKTNVDDEVVISLSGHGLVSKSLDFYYATYDMDFKNPESKGLMYDELDQLLDGIPARKKLLLIDACNSGELDKENTQITEKNKLPDNVKGLEIFVSDKQQSELGLQNSFELMQEMFVNLTRGNGAVVISAAGGKQFAYEGGQWNNGVFTYCILKGLKEKAADKNNDGYITVSELKDYVSTQVEQLTNGKQKPTSRSENLEFDFKVW